MVWWILILSICISTVVTWQRQFASWKCQTASARFYFISNKGIDINKLHYDFFKQKVSPYKNQHLSHSWGIDLSLLSQCRSCLFKYIYTGIQSSSHMQIVEPSCPAYVWCMSDVGLPMISNTVGKGLRLDDNGLFLPQRACWHHARHRNVKMILVLIT